jgi:hypothetical protein
MRLPDEPGDRDSTKLWPIVEPVDHTLVAGAGAMLLFACAVVAINWAFS